MATAAEEQSRFEIAPALPPHVDLVGAMLEANRGDYRIAVADLMADANLRYQLYTASCYEQGMGRGWKPKYERIAP